MPPRGGTPTSDQYEQSVRDAVDDFSRRAPMMDIVTLSMQSGKDTYDLPAGFVRIVRVMSLVFPHGVILAPTGIIPVSINYQERWMVQGTKIKFYPVPPYSLPRDIWYGKGYTLDADESYPDLNDNAAGCIVLKANQFANLYIANALAGHAWTYSIAGESIDKTSQPEQYRTMAQEFEALYLAAVERYIGALGARADYAPFEYGTFGDDIGPQSLSNNFNWPSVR